MRREVLNDRDGEAWIACQRRKGKTLALRRASRPSDRQHTSQFQFSILQCVQVLQEMSVTIEESMALWWLRLTEGAFETNCNPCQLARDQDLDLDLAEG
jgi:hypothetical protein